MKRKANVQAKATKAFRKKVAARPARQSSTLTPGPPQEVLDEVNAALDKHFDLVWKDLVKHIEEHQE